MKASSVRAYLLVNAATLLWAGNMVLGRALREAVGPWTLAGLRAAVAAVPFGLLLLRAPRRAPVLPRDWLLAVGMALSGVVGFQVLQYTGLHYTTALNAGVVNATGPLMTLFLARLIGQERLSSGQVLGAALSLSGVVVVLSGGSWDALRGLRFNPGDLLVLGAVFLWAVYSLLGRALLGRHPTVWVTAVSTLAAVPLLAAPAVWESLSAPPAVEGSLILAVLYIGVGPSFLAFLAWNQGVRSLGASGAMAFYNTLPVYAGLLAGAALGEWPGS
ncbi:MAG: DMT family transporter, partial [Proteobacteria bacterium]|nr:DMT family transporter [Pseudomonadota bacterium]